MIYGALSVTCTNGRENTRKMLKPRKNCKRRKGKKERRRRPRTMEGRFEIRSIKTKPVLNTRSIRIIWK
jgi:hypothetical protein